MTDEKKSAIRVLIDLAKKDGELAEEELQFLQHIGKSLGIKSEDFKALLSSEEPVEFTPSPKEGERLIQLYRLILMMNVDLKVRAEEERTVRHLGMRYGLPALMTEALIEESKKSATGMIHEKRLIEIFRSYSN